MDKFWSWLLDKHGIEKWTDKLNNFEYVTIDQHHFDTQYIQLDNKQMLIGYMIEYLCDKKGVLHLWCGGDNVDGFFDILKIKIEELNK